jgi:RimJ/RimL family protein N-acetyltransferase
VSIPPYVIREATPGDAEAMIVFMKILADEPDNGTTYSSAAEFTYTLDEERDLIRQYAEADNGIWFVVEANGQFIGYASAIGGGRGYYGTLTLAVALAQAARGQGIGKALTQQVIDWCHANPVVCRLQLAVFANNARAIHIYEKLGFERESVWRRSFYKHGEFLDSIHMAILFEREHDEAS